MTTANATSVAKFLLLMSDEHLAAAMSCVGHPIVKTPNLDRLAARGKLFANAYTPSPICVPARAALATGLPAHKTGYWDNALAYDGRVEGWGHALQRAGVRVVSCGKLHYRDERDPTGFDHQILPMHIQDGVGQVWGSVRNPLPEEPRRDKMIGDVGAGRSKYNVYDERVAREAARWLRSEAPSDAPWLLFASFVAPHFPLIVPEAYLGLYDPESLPLPDLRPEDGYARHPWLERMSRFQNNDAEFESDAERRLAIAAYYGLCTFMDAQVGTVLDALGEAGFAEDAHVLYVSDHGETLGVRGRWGKSVLYGESTRIPMILAGKGVEPGVSATPVSLLDVAPTLAGVFGAGADPAWTGASLLDIAAAPDAPERTVFSEYHAVASPSGGFMIATARWKYHYYVGYPPELFDLASDPKEARNLAGDPAHAEIEAELKRALFEICAPEEVDARAKADQDRLIARFGGRDAASRTGPSGATSVPT